MRPRILSTLRGLEPSNLSNSPIHDAYQVPTMIAAYGFIACLFVYRARLGQKDGKKTAKTKWIVFWIANLGIALQLLNEWGTVAFVPVLVSVFLYSIALLITMYFAANKTL